jgi:hypothetical protein
MGMEGDGGGPADETTARVLRDGAERKELDYGRETAVAARTVAGVSRGLRTARHVLGAGLDGARTPG